MTEKMNHNMAPPQMDHSNMNHSKTEHEQLNQGNDTHADQEHTDSHGDDHHDHHAMMVSDFRKRFFYSLLLMVPILLLSPMIQDSFGFTLKFGGDTYLLFILSTVLFFYGGWPFLTGARDEFKERSPAMMMLIALAISVAYVYSSLTIFILEGSDFFWELATLIVIMLLGHWLEMKSVIGASKALEELVKLMPDVAHFITEDGLIKEVPAKSCQCQFAKARIVRASKVSRSIKYMKK